VTVVSAAREVAPRPGVTRLAWLLLVNSLTLGAYSFSEQ